MDFSHQSIMPIVSLDPGPTPEFDYGAFLQHEEADYDYLAEESSASGTSHTLASNKSYISPGDAQPDGAAGPSTALSKPASPQSGASAGASPPKGRLERRGHTKSRRGCFNCKRRRIKCQENRPACGHCVKTGLKCEYPVVPQVNHQPQHQIPLFSLQDMRLFQHFLLRCYPSHPLGNEGIWTHEIPCLSQDHEYLMHAILGMAAADLMPSEPDLVAAAMQHRVKAIKAIKKMLTDVPVADTFREGNALMATCFALTFQSVALSDGMAEFMTFCRGVIIVAIQMYMKGAKFLFHDFLGDDGTEMVRPFMEQLPLINDMWARDAIAAIRNLEPLCAQGDVEMSYFELILDMAENLRINSFSAYKALTKHYGWWIQLPHDKFQQVIDPSSQTFVLLATHWIALKQIMSSISEKESHAAEMTPAPQQKKGDMDEGTSRWLRHLNRQVEPAFRGYNAWPEWVEAQLDLDPRCFGRTRN